jgi:hypothetical protein
MIESGDAQQLIGSTPYASRERDLSVQKATKAVV